MLPDLTVPSSLAVLLADFRPCFTAPTFQVFRALVCGMLAATGRRTVCGMLVGAGLSRVWPHDRAHRFFAGAVWSGDEVGLVLARLVVRLLVPSGAPVTVAVDDTLFHRRGKKVWAAGWFHDGSAPDARQIGHGNNWVICGIVVTVPMLDRPVCLPVLARLVCKGTTSASRLWLAARMVEKLAATLPGRTVHAVGDAAYAGDELRTLPTSVTWTTRLRKDAALFRLAPPRTGRRGRPRKKGDRLGSLAQLAAGTAFTPVTVTRYGRTAVVHAATVHCLWYGVFAARPVTVVLVRDTPDRTGTYDLALVTTDTLTKPAQIIGRYAARWSMEVAIADAKQIFGVGQARNRAKAAVERTVPFGLTCQTLTTVWYALAGHHADDATDHHTRAPWYTTKTRPSTADMATKLRRVLIAAKYQLTRPEPPTPAEIHTLRLAWDTDAA
ncbi:IS701 family transposase [Protofrankia symbiont of Coriaria ruscifolia]|uniref:IS701 family transposase n=1 Tax=Protofrankia symbiont of Coriaria ruscifolia TaxID=1306542 RepID=UPI001F5F528D|nr:transposase [Protofrankia symbiont of Coriaria ruscifolia]